MSRAPSALRTVTCSICGSSFQTRHSQGKYCSEACKRQGARCTWNAYTHRNKEKRLEHGRLYYEKNRTTVINRTTAYHKTMSGKNALKVNGKRMREQYPERYAARQAVLVALRKGILVKEPCERCGTRTVHGHHPDYSRPLDVVWLCPTCHRKEHQAMRTRSVLADNQDEEPERLSA